MAERTPRLRSDRDEPPFKTRSLLRLAIWGGAAAAGLAVVVLAAYTNVGSQWLMTAMAPAPGQPSAAQLAARSTETENETRRLLEAVQILDADREQMLTRITSLERTLEDITGSIQRQVAATPPAASPTVISPPSSTATPTDVMPATTPLDAPAALAADTLKPEVGIEVGSAVNFDGLRLLWNSTRGANAALFDGLHPLVAVRENRRTRAVELRLMIGPFANAEAAARLCSMLSNVRRFCQPAAFEGQQFSLAAVPESRPAATPARRPTATPAPKTVPQNP